MWPSLDLRPPHTLVRVGATKARGDESLHDALATDEGVCMNVISVDMPASDAYFEIEYFVLGASPCYLLRWRRY